ncbi:MAG: DUF3106 domain-containing protein [Acidobacteria bacterium]|nr:DUF3106 domain-containing protein [Acidobacteriota bacterium]
MNRRVLIAVLGAALMALPAGAQMRKGIGVHPKAKGARKGQAVDRFNRMTPEEREQVLKNLPPDRRKMVEKNLDRYNELTPEQRERLRNEYDHFQNLPPEKQQAARKVFRQMNGLSQERRGELRREAARLRRLSPEERKTHMGSEAFKGKYSAEEREIIDHLTGLFPPE